MVIMSKSTRNLIIAVAIVVVIGAAAIPFIIKATKAQKSDVTTEPPVTESTTVDEFTYPDEEPTTDELLTEIVTNLDESANTATTPAATSSTASAESTTKKNATTTSKASATTTKKSTSEKDASSDDFKNLEKVDAQAALADSAVVSYLWDPDGNFYYTEDNPWQRNFGFNVLYDWGAPLTIMFYDTLRAKFNYDNLEWMIQFWKGQYGYLFIGSEIGVYTREIGAKGTHYNCADDNHLINMEMSLYRDFNDDKGFVKLFTRSYYPHWWSTGFVDGYLNNFRFNDRSCLYLYSRLTMYDSVMAAAFADGLSECGLTQVSSTSQISPTSPDRFCVSGNDVYVGWRYIDQGVGSR
jgi:hypothetical protein